MYAESVYVMLWTLADLCFVFFLLYSSLQKISKSCQEHAQRSKLTPIDWICTGKKEMTEKCGSFDTLDSTSYSDLINTKMWL
jgi:hypothetical protein